MKPKMRVPPQPLAELQARYPKAVEDIYDQDSIVLGVAKPPSSNHKHIFECEDGWRLIVSRERSVKGELFLHLSASFCIPSAVHDRFEAFKKTREFTGVDAIVAETCRLVEERFRAISGDHKPMEFIGFTANFVPHWMRKDG